MVDTKYVENPQTKDQLIAHCKARLGEPLIKVNITDIQASARLKEAVNLFNQYHYDSTDQSFVKQQITQDDINNGYFIIPSGILYINKILQKQNVGQAILGIENNALPSMTSGSFLGGSTTADTMSSAMMQIFTYKYFVANYENILFAEDKFDFNPITRKLRIDCNFKDKFVVGNYITYLAEHDLSLFQNGTSDYWSNDWLIRYTSSLLKLQWAENLSKFKGMTLPGGLDFSSDDLKSEAKEEISALREELKTSFSEYPTLFVG